MLSRKLIIISKDGDGDEVQTTIPFDINVNASYQTLNTVARAINSLSQNTYSDSHLVQTVSLNEEIAE